jgi:phosphatidate cytidylyltransferase
LRIASALVLAPLALAAAYFGGWLFAAFWVAAAIAVLWEWNGMVAGPGSRLAVAAGGSALVAAAIISGLNRTAAAMLLVVLGALAAVVFAPADRRLWTAAGVGYAGIMLLAPLLLRADIEYGFIAILLIFAVVWTTDILAFFAGRAFGGPKLMPSVSPKKTWSGAVAGTAGAMLIAALVSYFFPGISIAAAVVIALLLSVASQLGDLMESAIKRRFGAKDAGTLIPGHGGVMDRLDGFWAAALIAALIGVTRGGFDAAARGFLVW